MKIFLILVKVFLVSVVINPSTATGKTPSWNIEAKDIYGKKITKNSFKDRLTVVSFSSRDSQEFAETFGQKIGKTFGHRFGYHTLIIPNTSQLNFLLKPFAEGKIKEAEEDAVKQGLKNQVARGNKSIKSQDVRSTITFIHDEKGDYWKKLGMNIENSPFYFAIINQFGKMVYVHTKPNFENVKNILEMELIKLARSKKKYSTN